MFVLRLSTITSWGKSWGSKYATGAILQPDATVRPSMPVAFTRRLDSVKSVESLLKRFS